MRRILPRSEMPLFLAIVVAVGMAVFGYACSAYLLRWKNGVAVLGGTVVLGPTIFLACSNGLGYFFPIVGVFRSMFLAQTLLGFGALIVQWRRGGIPAAFPTLNWPPRKTLWLLLAIALLAGLTFARDQGSDYWTWPHLALPASIQEGGFPVVEVTNPWHRINYHYGVPLLVAGIASLTGLELTLAHAAIPFLSAFGILFFSTALAYELSRSWKTAALCGILALFGSGLFWLQGWRLIRDLIAHYMLHQPTGGPEGATAFWWLTPSIRNTHAQALFMMLGHRPVSFGFSMLSGFLYAFRHTLGMRANIPAAAGIIASIALGLCLALTLETSFVVLCFVTGLWGVWLLWRRPEGWRRTIFLMAIVFIPMGIASLVQGGPLSQLNGETGPHQFEIAFDGTIRYNLYDDKIAIWNWRFIRDYGPHALLLILGALHLRKRKESDPFLTFLLVLSAVHFVIPFFVRYLPYPTNMNRLIIAAFGIVAIPGGVAIAEGWFGHAHRLRRNLGFALVAAMLLAGALHLPVRLLFPTLNLERTPLFPLMPSITPGQRELLSWVDERTTLQDRFFLHETRENESSIKDRLTFSAYSGRSPIGLGDDYFPTDEERAIFARMEACDTEAMDAMHIRYVAIFSPFHARWFSDRCTPSDWTLRFEATSANDGIKPTIYERNTSLSP